MGNAGHCTFGCGCLHGLRRADLQSSEEETRQKVVGSHRGCGICGCDSGGHSDRPDTDAALIGRRIASCRFKSSEMTSQNEGRCHRHRRQRVTAEWQRCGRLYSPVPQVRNCWQNVKRSTAAKPGAQKSRRAIACPANMSFTQSVRAGMTGGIVSANS